MTDPLTPEHLAELRRLHEAATPGPWRHAYHGTFEVEAEPNVLVADTGGLGHAKQDAHLIAAMHNALPALLNELDLLRREKAGWSPSLLSIAKQRNDSQALLDEVREVVDPKGYSSRFSSLRPAVEALLERASLPVLATCNQCSYAWESEPRCDLTCRDLPAFDCAPPSWCPLRGQR